MAKDIKRNLHDDFFQQALENPTVLKDVVEAYAPSKALEFIDTNKLELMPGHFISLEKRKFTTDVICKTQFKNHDGYLLLLIEQQSKPDEMMPFRIFRYICEIMAKHRKDKNQLPLVLPIVISNYKSRYPYSTDIRSLIHAPKALIDEYFMAPFHLIDLSQMDDEKLKERLWSGILSLAMKRIHSKQLSDVVDLLISVEEVYFSPEQSFSIQVLQYILEGSILRDDKALMAAIDECCNEKFRSKVMTLGQRLEARGEARGEKRGKAIGETMRNQEIVTNMLKSNFQADVIQTITGLEVTEIKKIADTLDLEIEA